MRLRNYRADSRGGFTLMELLVVVAILVVLAGAAVPLYMNYLEQAKRQMAWTNAKTLEKVADMYKIKNGDYPTSLAELAAPGTDGKANIEQKDLLDPFGREYMYAYPGQHSTVGKPDIWSLGANQNDPNGIIGNWLIKPP
jgi:general secretion pathway protein G